MANSKPKSVVLVSADGVESEVTSPTSFNNLVYGSGYKPKSGTVDAAYATLLDRAGDDQSAGAEKPASTVEKKAGS